MSSNDELPDKIDLTFSAPTLNSQHLEDGKHTFIIPFDDTVAALVGQIIAYWGAFEIRMDATTDHIATIMARDLPQNWKRLPFKKRKVMFRDLSRDYTLAMFPAHTRDFELITSTAADLHWRRNLVAHGYYEATPGRKEPDTGKYLIRYHATSVIKGVRQTIQLDEETLEKLWHDIAHLNGHLLSTINKMGGESSALEIVVQDKDLLQTDPQGTVRMLPISSRLQRRD